MFITFLQISYKRNSQLSSLSFYQIETGKGFSESLCHTSVRHAACHDRIKSSAQNMTGHLRENYFWSVDFWVWLLHKFFILATTPFTRTSMHTTATTNATARADSSTTTKPVSSTNPTIAQNRITIATAANLHTTVTTASTIKTTNIIDHSRESYGSNSRTVASVGQSTATDSNIKGSE